MKESSRLQELMGLKKSRRVNRPAAFSPCRRGLTYGKMVRVAPVSTRVCPEDRHNTEKAEDVVTG